MNTCEKCGTPITPEMYACRVCRHKNPAAKIYTATRELTKPVGVVPYNQEQNQTYVPTRIKPGYAPSSAIDVAAVARSMRPPFYFSYLEFWGEAAVIIPPTNANEVNGFPEFTTRSSTNPAKGLRLAREVCRQFGPGEKIVIIGTDGMPTDGLTPDGDPVDDALAESLALQNEKVTIGSIAIKGGTSIYDERFVQSLASNPDLFGVANMGKMLEVFKSITKSATNGTSASKRRLLLLLMDVSLSMKEGTKTPEAVAVRPATVNMLRGI